MTHQQGASDSARDRQPDLTNEVERFLADLDLSRGLVSPTGELDLVTAPAVFDSARILRHTEHVTIDLSRVSFIDAGGLGAIVRLRSDLIAAWGTLELVGVTPRHARVFALGGLATLL